MPSRTRQSRAPTSRRQRPYVDRRVAPGQKGAGGDRATATAKATTAPAPMAKVGPMSPATTVVAGVAPKERVTRRSSSSKLSWREIAWEASTRQTRAAIAPKAPRATDSGFMARSICEITRRGHMELVDVAARYRGDYLLFDPGNAPRAVVEVEGVVAGSRSHRARAQCVACRCGRHRHRQPRRRSASAERRAPHRGGLENRVARGRFLVALVRTAGPRALFLGDYL